MGREGTNNPPPLEVFSDPDIKVNVKSPNLTHLRFGEAHLLMRKKTPRPEYQWIGAHAHQRIAY
jgi:hypothetical protein